MAWAKLSRLEQLNESCDYAAKMEIYEFDSVKLFPQRSFHLEPISMFVDKEKMTSDTGGHLRFHAHRILAKEFFTTAQSKKSLPLLSAEAFEAGQMFTMCCITSLVSFSFLLVNRLLG